MADNIDHDIAVHLDLAALRELIKRVERDGDTNERDFSWWKPAFELLRPPPKDQDVD